MLLWLLQRYTVDLYSTCWKTIELWNWCMLLTDNYAIISCTLPDALNTFAKMLNFWQLFWRWLRKKVHGFTLMNVNSGELTQTKACPSLFPYSKSHYSSKESGCSFQQGRELPHKQTPSPSCYNPAHSLSAQCREVNYRIYGGPLQFYSSFLSHCSHWGWINSPSLLSEEDLEVSQYWHVTR